MNKSRKFAALVIITVILSGFYEVAFAQYDEGENPLYIPEKHLFFAGLVCGVNLAQVDGDNFAGYYKAGLNVGGIGYYHFSRYWALSWEFLYSQKGSKSNIVRQSPADTFVIIEKYGININYAEIPVMINYFDKHKSHIGLGVSYNRLVNGSEYYSTYPSYPIDLSKYPFSKNTFDFLAGAQMHMWKGLFLNIRFAYSIVPIRSTSPPVISRSNLQYNNMWTVRLMYLLM